MTNKYSLRGFLRKILERLRHLIQRTKGSIALKERNRNIALCVRNRNMSKLTLNDVTNIDSITTINANFDKLEQELQNKVLYRDNPLGEPNALQTNLDVNGKDLLNVGKIYLNTGDTWASSSEIFAVQAAVETDRVEVAANKDITVAAKDTAVANAATVASIYDSFDDRYLGVKSSDPTVDNDGNTLVQGALYFSDQVPKQMKVYNGSAWQAVATFNTTTTTSIDASLYASQVEAEQGTNNTKVLTALRTAQAIAANTGVVHRTGDETIAGVKTFSSAPNGTYGKLLNIQIFDVAGSYTYTETSGTRWIEVVAVGAGGSQGAAAPSAAGSVQVIRGGRAGGYVKARLGSGMSGASLVVGAGYAGGVSYPDEGTNGGNTTFIKGGTTITAYGGQRGGAPVVSSSFPFTVSSIGNSSFACTGSVLVLDSLRLTGNDDITVVDSTTRATIAGGSGVLRNGASTSVVMTSGFAHQGLRGDYYAPPKDYSTYFDLYPGRSSPNRVISGAFSGFAEGFAGSAGCIVIYEYA